MNQGKNPHPHGASFHVVVGAGHRQQTKKHISNVSGDDKSCKQGRGTDSAWGRRFAVLNTQINKGLSENVTIFFKLWPEESERGIHVDIYVPSTDSGLCKGPKAVAFL